MEDAKKRAIRRSNERMRAQDVFKAGLLERFPKLFAYIDPSSRMPITRGIECGRGWYVILGEAFELLANYEIKITQVKEKFGGLRIYYRYEPGFPEEDKKAVDSVIGDVEATCWRTCEVCGKPAQTAVRNDWRYTNCGECIGINWEEREELMEKLREEGKLLTPLELMFGKVKEADDA